MHSRSGIRGIASSDDIVVVLAETRFLGSPINSIHAMSDPAAAGPSSINGATNGASASATGEAKKSTKEMTKAERRELQVCQKTRSDAR